MATAALVAARVSGEPTLAQLCQKLLQQARNIASRLLAQQQGRRGVFVWRCGREAALAATAWNGLWLAVAKDGLRPHSLWPKLHDLALLGMDPTREIVVAVSISHRVSLVKVLACSAWSVPRARPMRDAEGFWHAIVQFGAGRRLLCTRPACCRQEDKECTFPRCECRFPYCSRACHVADWPRHKLLCKRVS